MVTIVDLVSEVSAQESSTDVKLSHPYLFNDYPVAYIYRFGKEGI